MHQIIFAWNAAASGDIVTAPGLWSLDNFGNKLIATINGGESFEWDSNPTGANNTRATIISGAPTASAFSLVSTPDRHLIFFGTETTIGTKSTQDPMFIRFSSQEDINTYTPQLLILQVHKDLQMDLKLLEQLEVRCNLYLD